MFTKGMDGRTNSLFLIQKQKGNARKIEGLAQCQSLNLCHSLDWIPFFFKYFSLNHPSVSMSGMLQKHTMKMEKSKNLYPPTFRICIKIIFLFQPYSLFYLNNLNNCHEIIKLFILSLVLLNTHQISLLEAMQYLRIIDQYPFFLIFEL